VHMVTWHSLAAVSKIRSIYRNVYTLECSSYASTSV